LAKGEGNILGDYGWVTLRRKNKGGNSEVGLRLRESLPS